MVVLLNLFILGFIVYVDEHDWPGSQIYLFIVGKGNLAWKFNEARDMYQEESALPGMNKTWVQSSAWKEW